MKSVSLALFTQSKDEINHYIMLKHGIIIILTNLIKTINNEKAIYWLIALLENCSLTEAYVVAIKSEDLVNSLIKRLNETNDYSLKSCIIGIFSKCAQDQKFCSILKSKNCLSLIFKLTEEALQKLPLISLSNRPPSAIKGRSELPKTLIKQVAYSSDNTEKPNEKLISNVTNTLAKCCLHNPDLVEFLTRSKILEKLVHILYYYQSQYDYKAYYSDNTIVNITKAISVWAYNVENRKQLLNLNGIRIFINLLKINNDEIIVNICHILGICSMDKECLDIIQNLEGIRLIWSLLRNNNPKVQESACWLLYVCIERIINFGELVRNLTGGIELLLDLLDNDHHTSVLAYACATISKVAIDSDNLAIMSDYKLIEKLIKLCLKYFISEIKEFLLLKMFLAEAISKCSLNIKNSIKLGESGIIRLLVKHLVSNNLIHKNNTKSTNFNFCPLTNEIVQINDLDINGSIIKALKELSNNTMNCRMMFREGIIAYLIESIGSVNEEVQEHSAICLKNIRKAIN
jgi:hypothetical protein